MQDYQISFSAEAEGVTFVAILAWDFDNWCHDGFYALTGTNLTEKQIFDGIYGDVSELEEWEESTHQFPNSFARYCTDEEIDLHFNPCF